MIYFLALGKELTMTEEELMLQLSAIEGELKNNILHKFVGAKIFKGKDWEDWKGVQEFVFDDFFYNLNEVRDSFVAALFDLSLAHEVKELRFSVSDLEIFVGQCSGNQSNITAQTIERMLSLVMDKDYSDEINK